MYGYLLLIHTLRPRRCSRFPGANSRGHTNFAFFFRAPYPRQPWPATFLQAPPRMHFLNPPVDGSNFA